METANLIASVCFLVLLVSGVNGYVRIFDPLKNASVAEGGQARFVCKVEVHPLDAVNLVVTWRFDGHLLTPGLLRYAIQREEGTTFSLSIRNIKRTDKGLYSCIAAVGLDTDVSSAYLQIKTVPEAPINVKVTSCHGNSGGVSWEPGSDNGAAILGYIVQFNTSDSPDIWNDYDEQFDSSRVAATLQLYPWGTYSFRVKARNILGSSQPSITTSRMCTTPPDRPDRNPSNVRTRTDVKKALIVEWTPMSRLYFHGPRFRYQVKWRMKGTFTWNSAYVTNPNQGSLNIETNDVYTVYELQVKAENSMGEAHQPAFIYLGNSGESEPLISPANFSLNPDYRIDPHTVHLVWDSIDPSNHLLCGKFKGYKLLYWKTSEDWTRKTEIDIILKEEANSHSPQVKVTLSDLPAHAALRAQVAVMNSHYTGPFSDFVDFFTPEGVPGPVRELRQQAIGIAYVLLQWKPPLHPNGIILGYDIAYQQVFDMHLGHARPLLPHINNPSTLGARVTGLQPAHRYRFIVWARTKQGRGEPTFVDTTTATGQPPITPHVHVSELRNSSVNITWVSDQPTPDIKYAIEYRQSGHPDWHNTDYVHDQSWMMLDKANVPVTDLEVRLVASNKLGDTATSKTVALAKTSHLDNKFDYLSNSKQNGASSMSHHWPSNMCFITRIFLALSFHVSFFQR